MATTTPVRTIHSIINDIGFVGHSLISISDLSDDQLYGLFELAKTLEPWNRSKIDLFPGAILGLLFFQPSTRTRMSFETAITRLGGKALVETNPEKTSSIAKEESLEDMMRCVCQYANVIVLRHYDDQAARSAAAVSTSPIINGGWGHWEHPTQALLDLYAMWRTFGHIKDLTVCVAAADMVEARTGHSMAYGLARLGAKIILASRSDRRTPPEVMAKLKDEFGVVPEEVLDSNQDSFNELVSGVDLIYLPGCSAPKGATSDFYRTIMDDYYVRAETLEAVRNSGRDIYITHTLPRRAGEMDLRIDDTDSQLCFRSISHSVNIRMALVASILGL
ncbi:MAG: hypothetical protein LBR27_03490 [Bifidobacteriaceae bacterium]|jgi:aspartate carbamoyltransferase catalytic subunit|nr:hypothetical protein [Bifidobacteriaceae bacterium]